MPSISGWQRVSVSLAVGSGNTSSDVALAPSGKKIVGGGFTLEDTDLVILASRPSTAGDGWEVIAHNNGANTRTVTIFGVAVDA